MSRRNVASFRLSSGPGLGLGLGSYGKNIILYKSGALKVETRDSSLTQPEIIIILNIRSKDRNLIFILGHVLWKELIIGLYV